MTSERLSEAAAPSPRTIDRFVILTCRHPSTDFRKPLADELHRLGYQVTYIWIKRQPTVTQIGAATPPQTLSVPAFLRYALANLRRPRTLFFNSTNLTCPGFSLALRILCGGTWCFDLHDDLLYDKIGMARLKGILAQIVLTRSADFMVHAAPTLQELFPKSLHLGNASDIKVASRSDPLKRILILASLDVRMDFDVVRATALAAPSLAFDIFGQISKNDQEVRTKLQHLIDECPNVTYCGAYDNVALPDILSRYLVTFAPYVINSRQTRYIDPLRYYHCLNSGLEVVSTDIPKARDFAETIHILASPQAFGPLVDRLNNDPTSRKNRRPAETGLNWRDRAIRLIEIVDQQLSARRRTSKP